MKVLVTGAAGSIGSVTCEGLRARDYQVRAADVTNERGVPELELTDVGDPAAAARLAQGMDAVVHLANIHAWKETDYQKGMLENFALHATVFNAALRAGVRKIIFASSVHAFFNVPPRGKPTEGPALAYLPADGDLPGRPASPYGLSKLLCEVMLENLARLHGVQSIALRLPWITARPVQELAATARNHPAMIRCAYAYLPVADVAALIDALLRADLPGFRRYFPAAARNSLNLPPAELIAEHYANVPLRQPADQIDRLVDTSRITEETGWRPRE